MNPSDIPHVHIDCRGHGDIGGAEPLGATSGGLRDSNDRGVRRGPNVISVSTRRLKEGKKLDLKPETKTSNYLDIF